MKHQINLGRKTRVYDGMSFVLDKEVEERFLGLALLHLYGVHFPAVESFVLK